MSIFSVKIAQRLRRGWQGSLFGNRYEVYEMWGEQACGYTIAMQSLRSLRGVRNNTAGMSLLPNANWTDEFHISTFRFFEHFHQRWTPWELWSYRRTLFMKTFFSSSDVQPDDRTLNEFIFSLYYFKLRDFTLTPLGMGFQESHSIPDCIQTFQFSNLRNFCKLIICNFRTSFHRKSTKRKRHPDCFREVSSIFFCSFDDIKLLCSSSKGLWLLTHFFRWAFSRLIFQHTLSYVYRFYEVLIAIAISSYQFMCVFFPYTVISVKL